MQPTKIQFRNRSAVIIACVAGVLIAPIAGAAPCPPGYQGSSPRCMPDQAKPHSRYVLAPKMVDRSRVKPQPGAPIEHQASASNMHGIIFVGGKNAINSQPVPPGHSPDIRSINSQPVPPGRAARFAPRPGAPIEKKAGH